MSMVPDRDGPVTRLLFRGLTALNVAGALLVLTLLVIINIDSLSRTFLSISFLGVTEVVELSLVAIVFLQLGDAVRSGRLTRSDGLLTLLGERAPRLRALLHLVFDLIAAAFMALIVAGGVPRMIESYQRGEFKGTAQLFTVPEWPVKLIIVIGATAAIVAFLISAWREFRRMTQR
ncbi:MAG: TRAP transporter small permease subunit [Burkholderiales bacterium]